ncbi:MAG: Panacea domain-containing protein [Alphaproteobacteria bacterium]|nr:Panacea domain-containing protein [Alphaproteobacteria bacterium]
MFSELKATQMAVFFLGQASEKRMSHLKLMKLLYLADRENIHIYGYPISYDRPVAMPHGPVLSRILDLMNGSEKYHPNGWESWISAKENHEIALRKPFNLDELTKFSPAELEVMQNIWQKFGAMTQWQIRDWTHDNCREWRDTNGSSYPIKYEDIALAVGYDSETAKAIDADIQEDFALDRVLKTAKA